MQKPLVFWFLHFQYRTPSVDKHATADVASVGFSVMSFWCHGLSCCACNKRFNLYIFILFLPSSLPLPLSLPPFPSLPLFRFSLFPFPFCLFPLSFLSYSPPSLPLLSLFHVLFSLSLFLSTISLSSPSSFHLFLSLPPHPLAPRNSATGEANVDNKNQSFDFLSISLHMSDNEKAKEKEEEAEVSTK